MFGLYLVVSAPICDSQWFLTVRILHNFLSSSLIAHLSDFKESDIKNCTYSVTSTCRYPTYTHSYLCKQTADAQAHAHFEQTISQTELSGADGKRERGGEMREREGGRHGLCIIEHISSLYLQTNMSQMNLQPDFPSSLIFIILLRYLASFSPHHQDKNVLNMKTCFVINLFMIP